MKKILAVILSLALALSLSGCMYMGSTVVLNADGTGTIDALIEAEKEPYDLFLKNFGADSDIFGEDKPEVITKDGKEYYQFHQSVDFASLKDLKEALAEEYENVMVSENGIRICMPASMTQADYDEAEAYYKALGADMSQLMKYVMTVKMPAKITAVSSIGTISEDGYTATFELELKDFVKKQEMMVSTAKEENAPTISGVKNGSTYNKAVTFTANDLSGIKSGVYRQNNGKETSFDITKKLTKNGKYTVKVSDYYDNEKSVTFTIKDTKKPVVTGVKNKKTYIGAKTIKFKDNCGISKATLNGKKITSGKKVSKKASYKLVVTDVNGLKTTVSFKIK